MTVARSIKMSFQGVVGFIIFIPGANKKFPCNQVS